MRCRSACVTCCCWPACWAMKLAGQGRTWSTTAVLCTPSSVTGTYAGAAMVGWLTQARAGPHIAGGGCTLQLRAVFGACRNRHTRPLRRAHLPTAARGLGPMAACTPHAAASAGAVGHCDRAARSARVPRCAAAPAHSLASVTCRVGGHAISRAARARLSRLHGPVSSGRRGSSARVAWPTTTTCSSGLQSPSETSRCGPSLVGLVWCRREEATRRAQKPWRLHLLSDTHPRRLRPPGRLLLPLAAVLAVALASAVRERDSKCRLKQPEPQAHAP